MASGPFIRWSSDTGDGDEDDWMGKVGPDSVLLWVQTFPSFFLCSALSVAPMGLFGNGATFFSVLYMIWSVKLKKKRHDERSLNSLCFISTVLEQMSRKKLHWLNLKGELTPLSKGFRHSWIQALKQHFLPFVFFSKFCFSVCRLSFSGRISQRLLQASFQVI